MYEIYETFHTNALGTKVNYGVNEIFQKNIFFTTRGEQRGASALRFFFQF